MEQQIVYRLTIAEVRRTYHDVNDILAHWHLIWDNYIGIGIFFIRKYIIVLNTVM